MSSFNISINEENCELSALYWIPKFQKNQYLDRYIPCSSTCSTKELSITMTKIVHAVKGGLLSYCDKVYSHGNINQKHRIGGVMISVLASSAVDHVLCLLTNDNNDNPIIISPHTVEFVYNEVQGTLNLSSL